MTANNDNENYEELHKCARREIKHNQKRVDDVIIDLARKLEEKGMPKWMICSDVIKALDTKDREDLPEDERQGLVNKRYIQRVLPEEYKDRKLTTTSDKPALDEGKNVIEEDEDEDLEEEKKPILISASGQQLTEQNDRNTKENLPIIESKTSKPNIVNTQKQQPVYQPEPEPIKKKMDIVIKLNAKLINFLRQLTGEYHKLIIHLDENDKFTGLDIDK